jgi:hypothetical protein
MRSVYIYIIVIVLLLTSNIYSRDIYDNHGLGVLNLRSQSVAQSLRLTLPMMVPNFIKKGYSFQGDLTWTNVWANRDDYMLDYEMLEYTGGLSYGFESNWGIKVEILHREFVGGNMDSLIQGFHDTFGIGQNGRTDYPKNRHIINFYDQNTSSWRSADADELNNTGLNFLLNYDLYGNQYFPCINIFAVGRYTLESVNFVKNVENFDYGVGVGISKRLTEHLFAYAVLGYTFYRDDEVNTDSDLFVFEKEQRTGMLALAWQYHSELSFVCQFLYGDPLITNISGLDEPSKEVHLGLKMRLFGKHILSLSLIENVLIFDNSPDFGFHMGIQFAY